jgi:hypothetical protein
MKIALSLRKLGINSDLLHGLGLASIGAAVSLWAGPEVSMRKDRQRKMKASGQENAR